MAIKGFLEYADRKSVRGWAFDGDLPDHSLQVLVAAKGRILASGSANIQRSDLAAAGIGDGRHAFNIAMPDTQALEISDICVTAISPNETVRLSMADQNLVLPRELRSLPDDAIFDAGQHPVFVLGAARSGTSALALGLINSARYEGTGEGHLLPLALSLLGEVESHFRRVTGGVGETMASLVPSASFQRFIRRAFVRLARDLYPTGHWVDKTPTREMVLAAPLMLELWPNARFIFLKRRVIENVLSRRRKFPQDTNQAHYSDWAAVMSSWQTVREKLGITAIEIEHRLLVQDPRGVAEDISRFLEMPNADGSRFTNYLQSHRPEQTDATFGETYDFDDLQLDEAEAAEMKATCDQLMAEFGYSYDRGYFGTMSIRY